MKGSGGLLKIAFHSYLLLLLCLEITQKISLDTIASKRKFEACREIECKLSHKCRK